jgi:hypothetical protein
MSTQTQHAAADLIQLAARDGTIALYVESLPDGNFRLLMPETKDMGKYAELLYAAADACVSHAAGHHPAVKLRD